MNRERTNRNMTDTGRGELSNMQNSMNGMQNGTNGMNGNGRVDSAQYRAGGRMSTEASALLKRIHELSFVKVELELYLDTHPTCAAALDYYERTVAALNELTEQYQTLHGPLFASGNNNSERWDWISSPWPWHRGDENNTNGRGGR